MAPSPPRALGVALAAGAALLARRALHRRIDASPLWPLPALPEPISGQRTAQGPTTLRRVVVIERTVPADGVVQLRLASTATATANRAPRAGRAGNPLPPWQPGAHLDVVLPSGLTRQFSLCGDPADRAAYTIAARLITDGDGGSREVHEQLREGTEISVRGPRNRFPLVDSTTYQFIAGGIGITPVLPMLRAVEAAGAQWRLLYCGRSRAAMPFLDEIEALGSRGERVTVVAGDESGRADLSFIAALPAETAVYCCGPSGLMDAVGALLPAGRTPRLERFTASTASTGDGGPFDIELRRSGRTVTVAPGQSALAAIRAELPNVPYSCQQGFCGTCRQRVLAGEVEHRDELLSAAEQRESMLICVSRCRDGRLVLDL
ncbi:PDR/VanB family oxidoreductase [Streptomyces albipurpureus]|uniref:PDR/VanB family oxidoreductase n=1 Tax=Streptomyces albipurpureus TaxID=2897419 RepID=A0ABT0UUJ7_9ACTN|nr:PDR/VanB family oxidoreductase [Streptomyces sp. CWNU-1]MCM2391043.1 PDR/VanB family oxidoreductase [Streptomyces sp. CWNU-1]